MHLPRHGLAVYNETLDAASVACANALDELRLCAERNAAQLKAGATLAEIKGIPAEDSESLYRAVAALMAQERFADALPIAALLAAHMPLDARFTFATGTCLQILGEANLAAAFYGVALQVRADAATTFRLGECLASLGLQDQALQCFSAVTDLADDDDDELVEFANAAAASVRGVQ